MTNRTHLPDTEKLLDKYIAEIAKKLGCKYIKMGTQYNSGLPDRMILLKSGKAKFLELKSKNGKATELQKYTLCELDKLGFETYIVCGGDSVCILDKIFE